MNMYNLIKPFIILEIETPRLFRPDKVQQYAFERLATQQDIYYRG